MPGGFGIRTLDSDEVEHDPEYEAALRAYVAAHPADVPNVTVRKSAPPPMAAPVAALQSMSDGAAPNRRITGPTLTLGPNGSVGSYDVRGEDMTPPPTPEGEAMFRDIQEAARASQPSLADRAGEALNHAVTAPGLLQAMQGAPRTDRTPLQRLSDTVDDIRNPLPDAKMPDLPTAAPASVPELEPKPTRVEIGHAVHVGVPNTAVARSALTAPIAPGEGRAPPPGTPAPAQDPVRRALTALALSADPSQGQGDLDAALQAASGRRLVAGLARAGGAMVGRGQGAGYDNLDREADRPVEEFQARQALSEQERQHQALKAAADAARGKEAFSEDMAKKKLGLEEAQLAETTRSHKAEEALKGRKLAGAGGAGGAGLSKQAAKELAVLERSWDPSGPRSGERGKNQARVNAAGRIEALAMGPDGKVADLNPQQMTELARQLDTLLSNGGQATEGVTKALSAHTASGKVAELEQWLTSAPHGAGQRAFVQQMVETAHREKDVAGGQLRDSYIQTLPSVPTLLKERPDVIQNMLKAAGVDPEGVDLSTGLRRASSPAPAARPPAPGMVRIRDPKTGRTGWAKPNAVPPGAEVVNAS